MVRYLTAPTITLPSGEVGESPLPPRIDRIASCESCPHKIECTIYQVSYAVQNCFLIFNYFNYFHIRRQKFLRKMSMVCQR